MSSSWAMAGCNALASAVLISADIGKAVAPGHLPQAPAEGLAASPFEPVVTMTLLIARHGYRLRSPPRS